MTTPISPTTTLLYTEILDRCLQHQIARKTGFDFTAKRRGDRTYWYLQHVIGASRKQYYLGDETPELTARIAAQRARWAESLPGIEEMQRLAAMAIRGGCMALDHPAYKVLAALEQAGVFMAGATLVGSYAFQAYGNMLGRRWDIATAMTQDADLAASRSCLIAVPGEGLRDLRKTVEDAGLNIRDIPMLNPKSPATGFEIRGTRFRVDLLTPLVGRPDQGPVHIKGLGAHASPVRFLDFLLEDTQKAVLLGKDPVLVNVPAPARFALHKLVVAGRRPATSHVKAQKDIRQAERLLDVLFETRPGDIALAIEAAEAYKPAKFLRELKSSVSTLDERVAKKLRTAISHTALSARTRR